MYFEEKIEQIKKEFSSSEFKIPFNDATQILKIIETHFIRQKDISKSRNNVSQNCNKWTSNMKEKEIIESVQPQNINDFLNKFEPENNYWLVIAWRENPQIKHQIYDTKLNALKVVVSIHQNNFFIIDKKYKWLYFFDVDKENDVVIIYKSVENKKVKKSHRPRTNTGITHHVMRYKNDKLLTLSTNIQIIKSSE